MRARASLHSSVYIARASILWCWLAALCVRLLLVCFIAAGGVALSVFTHGSQPNECKS